MAFPKPVVHSLLLGCSLLLCPALVLSQGSSSPVTIIASVNDGSLPTDCTGMLNAAAGGIPEVSLDMDGDMVADICLGSATNSCDMGFTLDCASAVGGAECATEDDISAPQVFMDNELRLISRSGDLVGAGFDLQPDPASNVPPDSQLVFGFRNPSNTPLTLGFADFTVNSADCSYTFADAQFDADGDGLIAYSGLAAQTYVVNSIADDPDANIDGVCDTGNLRGGMQQCTLRAAMQEANANDNGEFGRDNIEFNITNGCVNDICTIVVDIATNNQLPNIQDPINIDGSTQPGNAAVCTSAIPDRPPYRIVIEGNGTLRGLHPEFGSDGSVIRGLNIRNFDTGIDIARSDNNVVECNFIGSDETGTVAGPGNTGIGVLFTCDSSNNIIGGLNAEDGNLISANGGDGVQFFAGFDCSPLNGSTPEMNSLLGNYIGVQKDGVNPLGNVFSGVTLFGGDGSDNNFIGQLAGSSLINGNIIAANSAGIFIDNNTNGTVISGNYLGTDLSGTVNLGNEFGGVDIISGTDNLIGGASPAAANTIAFNGEGVFIVDAQGFNNRIQRNRMFNNIGLGIELVASGDEPDGQNPNDPDDSDIGPNQLQNYPEFISATEDAGMVTVEYSVPSLDLPLSIELFQADSDLDEGEQFVLADDYTTVGTATVIFPNDLVDVDSSLIATATDANGNTSEFSVAEPIVFLDLVFRDSYEAN